jgi:hypothetical protein
VAKLSDLPADLTWAAGSHLDTFPQPLLGSAPPPALPPPLPRRHLNLCFDFAILLVGVGLRLDSHESKYFNQNHTISNEFLSRSYLESNSTEFDSSKFSLVVLGIEPRVLHLLGRRYLSHTSHMTCFYFFVSYFLYEAIHVIFCLMLFI